MEELIRRLGGRGTNTEEDMKTRLRAASEEIAQYKSYDYVIVNDILEDALETLKSVVAAQRTSAERVDEEWIRNNFLNEEAV
jgi:guanylate kinase